MMSNKDRSNTNVVMVFPSNKSNLSPSLIHNLGAAYIVAYLAKEGIGAIQLTSEKNVNLLHCINEILEYKPKIVGFTVYNSNYLQCMLIAREIKRLKPKTIVVCGGATASVSSEIILQENPSIDICVRREGEEVFTEVVKKLASEKYNLSKVNLDNIKGISFRRGGEIFKNDDSNVLISNRSIENYLDSYPSPYISKILPASEAFEAGVITARGCNQHCTYCNCAALSNRNIFFHSVDRVISELDFLGRNQKQKRPIPIHDDAFTLLPNRARKICENIISSGIKIQLRCITRCDLISEDLLDLMKEAGFISIGFSLESAVPRVLRTIGKVHPPEDIPSKSLDKERNFINELRRMTSYSKKIGMNPVFVSIMVGLPGETPVDAQRTIDMVRDLDIDFYTHNILSIYRGTPLYSKYKNYGYRIEYLGENKIFQKSIHPYNVEQKIKMAKNSVSIKQNLISNQEKMKIIALSIKRKTRENFFNNVILLSNEIHKDLIIWLQKVISLNGNIIQIYTGRERMLKNVDQNISMLYKHYSPTLVYKSYYVDRTGSNLVSLSLKDIDNIYHEDDGFIKLINTKQALTIYDDQKVYLRNTICVDRKKKDTMALHKLLCNISKDNDIDRKFLNKSPYPFFLNLCKWTRNIANCITMETAIIRDNNTIQICWYGNSIGEVGMSMSELSINLDQLSRKTYKERRCGECSEVERCIKCNSPFPITAAEFCYYKRNYDTDYSASQLIAFDLIKDFTLKM